MRIINLLPCFCVSLAFACGGDSGGGGGSNNSGSGSTTINSGVDDSKPLNMLSDSELQQIGTSFGNAQTSETLADAVCKFAAKFASLDVSSDPNAAPTAAQVEACNDAYADCKAMAASTPPETMSPTEVPTNTAAFAGCNVTVGQYEACLTATLNALTQAFSAISCTSSGVPNTAAFAAQPDACAPFTSAQCTAALGS